MNKQEIKEQIIRNLIENPDYKENLKEFLELYLENKERFEEWENWFFGRKAVIKFSYKNSCGEWFNIPVNEVDEYVLKKALRTEFCVYSVKGEEKGLLQCFSSYPEAVEYCKENKYEIEE